MRNEPLHAYSLHQRPYQEKRSIYYLFTKEYGILHGIAKKGIPQFVPLTLFATGKKSLKTLQQVNIADIVPSLMGQQQYAALYINEITLKLLPVEDSMSEVYEAYCITIGHLQRSLSLDELKLVLRSYEQVLFNELGFAIDLEQDCDQEAIRPEQSYRFVADTGWVKLTQPDARQNNDPTANKLSKHSPSRIMQSPSMSGKCILAMSSGINIDTVNSWSIIHRQLVDHLFDYKPLQSRILWQQFYRYQ